MTGERKIKVPTTGLFDFPELILGGKGKYIDKTDLLYDLCNETDQQLFISRHAATRRSGGTANAPSRSPASISTRRRATSTFPSSSRCKMSPK